MAEEAAKSVAELPTESATTPVVNEPRRGTGSLDSLRLLGEDLECTISYDDPAQQATVEGTYFVSNGDLRGDFLTASPDLSGQILSSMILVNETMYVWSEIEGALYGVQFDLALLTDTTVETSEPIELDAEVTYDCQPWPNVDRTIFDPPSTVLFQDMNELMQAGMEYGTLYEEPVELR